MTAYLPLLPIYRRATAALGPISGGLLKWRQSRGKEDAARMGERMGRPSAARPAGRLAWLHGASVGEGIALLPLIDTLMRRGFHVLVTTGTMTSAAVLARRLPPGALHQFVPLDVPRFMTRFVDHWRPDIVLLAESELWPNLLCAVKERGVPLVVVNARLSARSAARWGRAPRMIGALLARTDLCLAQTQDDATRLMRLGAPRVQVAGNLKYDVAPPPVDAARLAELLAAIGRRPVWIAASTHAGEEALIGAVHARLKLRFGALLTIIAPRHPERGPEIAAELTGGGLVVAARSLGAPLTPHTDIYLADTIGELGLLYRAAGIVFMGKSLGGSGGQNPIEPAKLDCAILHGPQVGNFEEVYAVLDAAGGARVVNDAPALAREVAALLSDERARRDMARLGGEAVDRLGGAAERVMRAVEPYFMQMSVEGR